jgi:hypothetical protein
VNEKGPFDEHTGQTSAKGSPDKKNKIPPIALQNDVNQSTNQYICGCYVSVVFEKKAEKRIVKISVEVQVKSIFSVIGDSHQPDEINHKKAGKKRPQPFD